MTQDSRRTLIVEPHQTRRSMLQSGLKECGFTNIQTASDLEDVFRHIQSDEIPDWIITSLHPSSEPNSANAIHLLILTLLDPALHDCRVSLIVDDDELGYLANAFELGLYSWHLKAPDQMTQMASFANLVEIEEFYGGDPCLVSAHYLREFLKQRSRFDEIVDLQKTLLRLYPDRKSLIVDLAEALFADHKPKQALRVVSMVSGLDANAQKRADRLVRAIEEGRSDKESRAGFAQTYGVHRALVVDPDESVQNMVAEILRGLGLSTISTHSNGKTAFDEVQRQGVPDLIIHEWRLAEIPGYVFLQKIRDISADVPLIIYSSLVGGNDRYLLREMGVTNSIEKPKSHKHFLELLPSLLEEELRPSGGTVLARKIRQSLKKRNISEAKRFYDKLTQNDVPQTVRLRLDAEIAFYENRITEAHEAAIEALQQAGEDLVLLDLLGKIYMKLKRFKQAESFFERAQALSPSNVERLCRLAETTAGQGATEEAETHLENAKALDPENQHVPETEAKVALAAGRQDQVRQVMESLSEGSGVIAFLNNRAVSLVAEEKVEDSIALYRQALESIPKEHGHLKPVVGYNLALALTKLERTREALDALSIEEKPAEKDLAAKIKGLATKLEKALESGTPVALSRETQTEKTMTQAPEPAPSQLPVAEDVGPGDMRCHRIYQNPLGQENGFASLCANLPKFVEKKKKAAGKGTAPPAQKRAG